MATSDEYIHQYQEELLRQIRYVNRQSPIPQNVEAAYLGLARHKFVQRYRQPTEKEWRELHPTTECADFLPLYTDHPLIIFENDRGRVVSTISQPSLVLHMLDMLDIESGHKVFELGAGSGWTAAMMGQLVGSTGHVYSLEIIPTLAANAKAAIQRLGIQNVTIVEGDGGEGYASEAPYDRAIFTAGTYDLPRYFYTQIKAGGLLLVIIKTRGGGDCLFLLAKSGDHFESVESMQCHFVQMTGRFDITDELSPVCFEQLQDWHNLKYIEVERMPFWWSGKGEESFIWRTWGIRSFLEITEPLFVTMSALGSHRGSIEEQWFGVWDKSLTSLVLATEDTLRSYGTQDAKSLLIGDLEMWIRLGMPTMANFNLKICPSDERIVAAPNQWITKRHESQFVWSL
jgi:protein-L-isoaspartate(D-aspartate) O-methyltransferase